MQSNSRGMKTDEPSWGGFKGAKCDFHASVMNAVVVVRIFARSSQATDALIRGYQNMLEMRVEGNTSGPLQLIQATSYSEMCSTACQESFWANLLKLLDLIISIWKWLFDQERGRRTNYFRDGKW